MEQNNGIPEAQDAREVVLRYEASTEPVVERYVQPTPLPGRAREHAQAVTQRRKRGKRVFLRAAVAVVALSILAAALWFFMGRERRRRRL